MLFRIALLTTLALPVFAFDDNDRRWDGRRDDNRGYSRDRRDGYRDDSYRYGNNGRYRNNSAYGYGRQDSSVIDRTLRDLQSAASRNRVNGHERDHFNRAMSELQGMRYNGGSDYRRLDRVLEDLDHLSRADQVHPRDRQILARDRQALASLRGGGYGYNSNRW